MKYIKNKFYNIVNELIDDYPKVSNWILSKLIKSYKIHLSNDSNWHGIIVITAKDKDKARKYIESVFIKKMKGYKIDSIEEMPISFNRITEIHINYFMAARQK